MRQLALPGARPSQDGAHLFVRISVCGGGAAAAAVAAPRGSLCSAAANVNNISPRTGYEKNKTRTRSLVIARAFSRMRVCN